jgi:hypothetical protein
MIKLRISPDGTVRGLWTDAVLFHSLGQVRVRRASHVEFDDHRQCWTVREVSTANGLRKTIARLFGNSRPEMLFSAATRAEALAWEHEHFGPGGAGWNKLRP